MPRMLVALLALTATLALALTCRFKADVDENGVVDTHDLLLVQACLGAVRPYSAGCARADASRDGRVDILDLSVVLSQLEPPIVPDVAGLPAAEARQALVAAGLAPGAEQEVLAAAVAPGAVISQSVAAWTSPPAGTPVDLVVSAPVPAEPTRLPAPWMGEWKVRTTITSGATGRLVGVDEEVVDLCFDDPLGLALAPATATCTGDVDDQELAIACSDQRVVLGCTIHLDMDFTLAHAGLDRLAGRGSWTRSVSGTCSGLAEADAQTFQVHATRNTLAAASCAGSPAAVAQKLVPVPSVLVELLP